MSLNVNGLLPFLLDPVLTSSREGCYLTSMPSLSFPTCKMGVAWWLWRTAALGLAITVTEPSWTVGQEAQLQSLHHPNLHLATTIDVNKATKTWSSVVKLAIGVAFILARGSQPGSDEPSRDLCISVQNDQCLWCRARVWGSWLCSYGADVYLTLPFCDTVLEDSFSHFSAVGMRSSDHDPKGSPTNQTDVGSVDVICLCLPRS